MVGAARFELTTSCSQSKRSTKLSYTPCWRADCSGRAIATLAYLSGMSLVPIARRLAKQVGSLRFGAPVACVYHPLEYAWEAHRTYLERFARPGIEALFVGMNPGPFGMVQTGVPFGEIAAVRDFLGIASGVRAPAMW